VLLQDGTLRASYGGGDFDLHKEMLKRKWKKKRGESRRWDKLRGSRKEKRNDGTSSLKMIDGGVARCQIKDILREERLSERLSSDLLTRPAEEGGALITRTRRIT